MKTKELFQKAAFTAVFVLSGLAGRVAAQSKDINLTTISNALNQQTSGIMSILKWVMWAVTILMLVLVAYNFFTQDQPPKKLIVGFVCCLIISGLISTL